MSFAISKDISKILGAFDDNNCTRRGRIKEIKKLNTILNNLLVQKSFGEISEDDIKNLALLKRKISPNLGKTKEGAQSLKKIEEITKVINSSKSVNQGLFNSNIQGSILVTTNPPAAKPEIKQSAVVITSPEAAKPEIKQSAVVITSPEAAKPEIKQSAVVITSPEAAKPEIKQSAVVITNPEAAKPEIERPILSFLNPVPERLRPSENSDSLTVKAPTRCAATIFYSLLGIERINEIVTRNKNYSMFVPNEPLKINQLFGFTRNELITFNKIASNGRCEDASVLYFESMYNGMDVILNFIKKATFTFFIDETKGQEKSVSCLFTRFNKHSAAELMIYQEFAGNNSEQNKMTTYNLACPTIESSNPSNNIHCYLMDSHNREMSIELLGRFALAVYSYVNKIKSFTLKS